MKDWKTTMEDVYTGNTHYYGVLPDYESNSLPLKKYIEIPINADTVEVPVSLMKCFIEKSILDKDYNIGKIVSCFDYNYTISRYKSFDYAVRDSLIRATGDNKFLNKVYLDKDKTNYYYVGHGIIFDKHMNIIMLMSWKISKVFPESEDLPYILLKTPILRVTPEVISKKDSMYRLILNKIVPEIFDLNLYSFRHNCNFNSRTENNKSNFETTLIVSKIPFKIYDTIYPTINDTSKDLLNIVKENIKEIIYDGRRIF